MAGIYIHIPFCNKACYYCNFHFSVSKKNRSELVNCIRRELKLRAKEMRAKMINTIYFGGGTPSVLDVFEIETILDTIWDNYEVVAKPEVTLEANPDDLSLEKIKELASTKINRLSIGVQSFRDVDLQFMNRSHSAEEAIYSIRNTLAYFKNITVDLIYGIPELSDADWKNNILKLIEMDIPHVSAYALTVEKKTALHHFIKKGKLDPLSEKKALNHFNILVDTLEEHGYEQYEISNFAKPDYYSKHNTGYWQGERYIGIGPSAHSFNGVSRSWNVASNSKYIKAITIDMLPLEAEQLSVDEQFNEFVMTGLRTRWGIDLGIIENRFGDAYLNHIVKSSARHVQNGLMEVENEAHLKTTAKGKFLADGLASDLFIV
jgi:oxygen-independent coproporphyrinogen-3 oxidase